MRRTSTRRRSSSIFQMRRKWPTRYRQNSPRREPCKALPMLRGSSSLATRSRRNFTIRLACCGSSLRSSRSASTENSILQGMTFYDVFEQNSRRFAATDAVEGTLGEIEILKLLEVVQDCFPHIKSLGASGALGKFLQAFFDGFGETDGQHGTSLYKYSTGWIALRSPSGGVRPFARRGARTSFPGFPLPCAGTGGRRRHPRRGGRS